jgi:hypothetical protein
MTYRNLAVLAVACLLGGCTEADWDHAMTYTGLAPDVPVAAPSAAAPSGEAAPQQQAPAPTPAQDAWCSQIAKSVADEAALEGFDRATQLRRAQIALDQCVHTRGSEMH